MGCDIHVYLERHVNGEWRAVRPPSDWDMFSFEHRYGSEDPWAAFEWYIERNYGLFGRLAGVRSRSETPIATPRGLPPDGIDTPTREALINWGPDAHVRSWLMDTELATTEWEALSGQFARLVNEVCERSPARIVFWFDN